MLKSDSISNLVSALIKARSEFGAIVKTAENPYFKSKYAPLDSVIDATTNGLAKHGLVITQLCDNDALITMLAHTSGEWIASRLILNPAKQDPQGNGSAITYARRYSLTAILGIASEDDDDGNAGSHKPQTNKKEGNNDEEI